MKSLFRTLTLSLLAGLACMIMAGPAVAQTLYSNGPINGTVTGYGIYGGLMASDTFTLATDSHVTGFDFGAWVRQGDQPLTVDWSITSNHGGGTLFDQGTASLTNVFHNSYSAGGDSYTYDIYDAFATIDVNLAAGTYWLNLTNATDNTHPEDIYWDINAGVGCTGSDGGGADCPSLGYFNIAGTIPSESFNITGASGQGSVPEPGTLMLFGSGVIGLAGMVRRRLRP